MSFPERTPFLPSVPHAALAPVFGEPARGLRSVPRRNKRPEQGRELKGSSPQSPSIPKRLNVLSETSIAAGEDKTNTKRLRKESFCLCRKDETQRFGTIFQSNSRDPADPTGIHYTSYMIKAVISDFSRVLLFPRDATYEGSLNEQYKEHCQEPGYNVLDHFRLNTELLDYYASLQEKVDFYLFTSDIIQDALAFQPSLQPLFRRIFSAAKMGSHKRDHNAYQTIAHKLHLPPSEILYIDDVAENIAAAKAMGFVTLQYDTTQNVMQHMKTLMSKKSL